MQEYKIIQAESHEELIQKVNSFLNTGWELYGDLVIFGPVYQPGKPYFEQYKTFYYQSIVKNFKNTNPPILVKPPRKLKNAKT